MNPEHHPTASTQPNQRTESAGSMLQPTPETRHEHHILERLHRELGLPFQLYLDHHWRGVSITDMEDDFHTRYWGTFEHPHDFLTRFAEQLGWTTARADLLDAWAIPPDALVWDYDALLARLRDDYDIRTIEGATHVFIR